MASRNVTAVELSNLETSLRGDLKTQVDRLDQILADQNNAQSKALNAAISAQDGNFNTLLEQVRSELKTAPAGVGSPESSVDEIQKRILRIRGLNRLLMDHIPVSVTSANQSTMLSQFEQNLKAFELEFEEILHKRSVQELEHDPNALFKMLNGVQRYINHLATMQAEGATNEATFKSLVAKYRELYKKLTDETSASVKCPKSEDYSTASDLAKSNPSTIHTEFQAQIASHFTAPVTQPAFYKPRRFLTLFGPGGTGKTLMARDACGTIANVLKAHSEKNNATLKLKNLRASEFLKLYMGDCMNARNDSVTGKERSSSEVVQALQGWLSCAHYGSMENDLTFAVDAKAAEVRQRSVVVLDGFDTLFMTKEEIAFLDNEASKMLAHKQATAVIPATLKENADQDLRDWAAVQAETFVAYKDPEAALAGEDAKTAADNYGWEPTAVKAPSGDVKDVTPKIVTETPNPPRSEEDQKRLVSRRKVVQGTTGEFEEVDESVPSEVKEAPKPDGRIQRILGWFRSAPPPTLSAPARAGGGSKTELQTALMRFFDEDFQTRFFPRVWIIFTLRYPWIIPEALAKQIHSDSIFIDLPKDSVRAEVVSKGWKTQWLNEWSHRIHALESDPALHAPFYRQYRLYVANHLGKVDPVISDGISVKPVFSPSRLALTIAVKNGEFSKNVLARALKALDQRGDDSLVGGFWKFNAQSKDTFAVYSKKFTTDEWEQLEAACLRFVYKNVTAPGSQYETFKTKHARSGAHRKIFLTFMLNQLLTDDLYLNNYDAAILRLVFEHHEKKYMSSLQQDMVQLSGFGGLGYCMAQQAGITVDQLETLLRITNRAGDMMGQFDFGLTVEELYSMMDAMSSHHRQMVMMNLIDGVKGKGYFKDDDPSLYAESCKSTAQNWFDYVAKRPGENTNWWVRSKVNGKMTLNPELKDVPDPMEDNCMGPLRSPDVMTVYSGFKWEKSDLQAALQRMNPESGDSISVRPKTDYPMYLKLYMFQDAKATGNNTDTSKCREWDAIKARRDRPSSTPMADLAKALKPAEQPLEYRFSDLKTPSIFDGVAKPAPSKNNTSRSYAVGPTTLVTRLGGGKAKAKPNTKPKAKRVSSTTTKAKKSK